MKALIIKKPFIDLILDGKKTWEIRSSNVNIRGKIGLIQSGSGTIVGTCILKDSIGPLSKEEFNNNSDKHKANWDNITYKKTFAWVLDKAERIEPISYNHPQGAIIWVNVESI
ncbi:ASCH domain-containing protein [Nanoarchaeota archaeon]